MKQWEYVIDAPLSGHRIDYALAQAGAFSRNVLQRLIIQDRVYLDGRQAKKKDRVSEGQTALVFFDEPKATEALPEDIPLDIVYEDSDLVVVNKPRGLVVHPSPGHESGTLVNALLSHCAGSLSGIGGITRPGIVHRLDKDTSGLIVCAKNDFAHVALSAALKARSVSRIYECIARGRPKQDVFTISEPIGRHPENRKKQAVTGNGRDAVTNIEVLAAYPGYSHLRCSLETGRTHQIRVHLAHIGHPVAGDPLYCGGKDTLSLGGQCLHARELGFAHPRTGQGMRFVTELPDYFVRALEWLTAN